VNNTLQERTVQSGRIRIQQPITNVNQLYSTCNLCMQGNYVPLAASRLKRHERPITTQPVFRETYNVSDTNNLTKTKALT
jgi:hypothetical protein